MPAQQHIYTYQHLLRFGQTFLSSLVIVLFLSLVSSLQGETIALGLSIDVTLVLTIIVYVINYSHTFNAGIHLDRDELRIDRMLLDDRIIVFSQVRRIQVTQYRPQLATYFAGSRLSMRIVGEFEPLTIEVSDLHDPNSFLDALERITDEHSINVVWQNEKGEFLSNQSDNQQVSL